MFSSFLKNSKVKFIKRQVNEVVYNLDSAAASYANFYLFIEIHYYIQNIIMNEMR